MDLNLCQFIGRLGRDPEMRQLNNGDAVANFSLAVGWKSKGGAEGVEWVRCVAFGRLAEVIGQYMSKGSQCYVSGSMATRKWQNRDGVDQYTTEITVRQMQMLGGRREEQATPQTPAAAPAPQTPADDFDDSDVPF